MKQELAKQMVADFIKRTGTNPTYATVHPSFLPSVATAFTYFGAPELRTDPEAIRGTVWLSCIIPDSNYWAQARSFTLSNKPLRVKAGNP